MPDELPEPNRDLPSRRGLRATLRHAGEEISFRVPRRTHVPAAAPEPVVPRAPRTKRQKFAAAAALTSVCGLALVAAVPIAAQTDVTEAAAAQQELFSEFSAADMPDSFTDVEGIASEEITAASYTFNPKVLVNYPFASPVMLTDPFGYRTAPVEQFHDAQDFAASAGTPIQAIADGVVLEAGQTTDGCGFGLKLEHEIDGQTVTSRYCHMIDNSHTIQVGDTLKMGDPAGEVGSTGMSFGAHLHLALRVNDEPVDPMPFLAKYNTTPRDIPDRIPTSVKASSSDKS
ncbi:M23 family metallopeptidase [Leucobacter salsicius]|uniref:M23 family metallopeptidase n=1 Tax=Leucobacter salsicius TaxID=664638 RepID=UPI0012F7C2D8|nr:M23 family metallopeptidase [Leucobacter salsicius]